MKNKLFKIVFILMMLFVITSCKKKEVRLIYDANTGIFENGDYTVTVNYLEGDLINFISEKPIKENYVFSGWYYKDGTKADAFNIEKETILYAKWEERLYNVTYILESGTFNDGATLKKHQYKLNDTFISYEIQACEGLMFNGWYEEGTNNYIDENTKINKDMNVIAKFNQPGNLSNIFFELNGGTMDAPNTTTYYENIIYKLPTPTKYGCIFNGWYDNSECFGDKVIIQSDTARGDVTYYASWTITSFDLIEGLLDEFVPDKAYDSFELPSTYQGLTIEWSTDNPETISSKGIVSLSHKQEVVNITADINFNNEIYTYTKEVIVDAIVFEKEESPIAGYFFRKNIAIKSDLLMDNLNIAYYAFANISESGQLHIEGMSSFEKFVSDSVELRKDGLQIVLSIAGGALNFSSACYEGGYVSVGDQIIELVKKYHFDGVDIDWEYPSGTIDKQNMVELVKYLREQLTLLEDGTGSPYLLTAAIPSHTAYSRFDLKELNKYLDYVNMMSYDMHSAYRTTHNCPLYTAYNDRNSGNSIERGIGYFVSAGLDKDKIIIGGAYYGKAYKVTGEAYNQAKYPGLGASAEPMYLQLGSSYTVFYSYILDNILTNPKYVRYWDSDAGLPYLYNRDEQIFITYEDEESLRLKTEYAYNEKVGIMFWEYSYDYDNILTHAICSTMARLKNK